MAGWFRAARACFDQSFSPSPRHPGSGFQIGHRRSEPEGVVGTPGVELGQDQGALLFQPVHLGFETGQIPGQLIDRHQLQGRRRRATGGEVKPRKPLPVSQPPTYKPGVTRNRGFPTPARKSVGLFGRTGLRLAHASRADLESLQIGVEVEGVVAPFASDPGEAASPKGRSEVADQEGIDPNRPGPDRPAHPVGAFGGPGVDDRGQPVPGRIGQGNALGLVGEGLIGEDRPENLALHDLGVVGLGGDDGGLVPEPVFGEPLAPTEHTVPGVASPSTKPSTRLRWSGWIIGEMVVVGFLLSPSTVFVGVGVEQVPELLSGRLFDEQSQFRRDLAGSSNWPAGCFPGGSVEVGIGEDQATTGPAVANSAR